MNRCARNLLALVLTCALGIMPSLGQTPASQSGKPKSEKTGAAKPKPGPGTGAALLQLEDGRSGRGNLIATTGIRGFTKPESPMAHALIMAIGDYQGPIPKLDGVPFDVATSTEIARRMGVPAGNIKVMRDGELTLDGMRRALDALEAKLDGSDQVFVYYSGHGGRQKVTDDNGSERCAESLISVDGQGLTDAELESRLKRISQKAQKTIVLIDACHSGGVTTRAMKGAQPLFTPKSWTPPNQDCAKPTNVLTRSAAAPKIAGSGGANFVHIAASRDSEISLDQPGHGGVASQAWLACLAGAAKDTDGSGGLSAEEIRTCAQDRIAQKLKNVQGFLPHHVVVTGNSAMVLSYAEKEAPAVAPTAVPTAAPAPVAVAVAPSPALAPAAKPAPLAALNDIYNSRDDRRLVTLTTDKPTLKIGRDSIGFTLTSREGGHAYLLMVGSDGKTFDLLFPNAFDRNNVIEPGATLRLPRASWQLAAEGPPGKNTLLAIVTDSPRDFSAAGLKPSGPFSMVEAVAAKDIQLVTAGAATPAAEECSNQTSVRNIAVKKRCSTGYAAALLTVEEVR
ncbi:MAG: caspase family protein [Sulfuritalea sp.]|nr:caspase family protein [Sulfuritalea sp.]